MGENILSGVTVTPIAAGSLMGSTVGDFATQLDMAAGIKMIDQVGIIAKQQKEMAFRSTSGLDEVIYVKPTHKAAPQLIFFVGADQNAAVEKVKNISIAKATFATGIACQNACPGQNSSGDGAVISFMTDDDCGQGRYNDFLNSLCRRSRIITGGIIQDLTPVNGAGELDSLAFEVQGFNEETSFDTKFIRMADQIDFDARVQTHRKFSMPGGALLLDGDNSFRLTGAKPGKKYRITLFQKAVE